MLLYLCSMCPEIFLKYRYFYFLDWFDIHYFCDYTCKGCKNRNNFPGRKLCLLFSLILDLCFFYFVWFLNYVHYLV